MATARALLWLDSRGGGGRDVADERRSIASTFCPLRAHSGHGARRRESELYSCSCLAMDCDMGASAVVDAGQEHGGGYDRLVPKSKATMFQWYREYCSSQPSRMKLKESKGKKTYGEAAADARTGHHTAPAKRGMTMTPLAPSCWARLTTLSIRGTGGNRYAPHWCGVSHVGQRVNAQEGAVNASHPSAAAEGCLVQKRGS